MAFATGSLFIIGFYLLAGLLWLALAAVLGVFVYRDASGRGMDPLGWTLAAVLLPNLLGVILYLIMRSGGGSLTCPACGKPVRPDFHCCPFCGQSTDRSCPGCGCSLQPGWKLCPRCGAPAQGDPAPSRKNPGRALIWVLAAALGLIVLAAAGLLIFIMLHRV